ncbi:uncharacterized protein [Physcomitrium patens]|uniref:Glycoside hydrolase family 31 N-terminal domain-containing protein n=2 Tax=Physcomitrium patens TaxID=3218 RepID=A0A2K1J6V3_PHYPA|nr:uncharacterized protein LOC112293666 isoform X2 [Physcomitrium patens]XP_024399121.1 uncharacterized protein LOC112293666 isoform X2 [Physcomitrium patens]XP_024399122.1 uncharacterized protein LOC112293666 isoform X2 [Physcomitrium patens]PNR37265.1 hypothetical protein PHYPA_020373 [Physcomitrium patens]|eukprot:XP_024399119.1 uncharacterized protein LOC112293666 isoform X2 [Physcomitrella patens]
MAWMPIVGESIFRFDASDVAWKNAAPCMSLVDPKLREDRVDASNFERKSPVFLPQFEMDGRQQVAVLLLPLNTTFYGTGEVGGSLERTGKRIYTWNTDAWGYNQSTTSLYQSHPWVFCVLATGESFGVLADTTLRCEIDLRKEATIRIAAAAPYPLITFGPYPNPEALIVAFAQATGTIQLPPKWALGYQQCRWSYETAEKVSKIAHTFRETNIPCDVVWMDIDYMDGFKCFTFDKEVFPDPNGLSNELHNIGFKGIWMLDPGIKVEEGYEAYDTGSAEDVWIQSANGKPYAGECWPGPVSFPDFTNEKTRKWWSKLVKKFVANGVDGIWNDMNEPAVFKTVSKTMPETNIHRGDEEVGGVQPHSYYHNVYGMFQAKATYEGMLLANKDKRPFVLTRAGFVGAQRFAATWTGDNLATWEHLGMSIPMALNLGLSGQPFSGPDIGGFAGDATPKLFVRWMGIGSMMPFARGHSEKGTIDQEPWSFGPEVENLCRFALNRRYRFLPHFYTLFYQAHLKGLPVMTPLFFADPSDLSLRKRDDAFLLGPILVSVSLTPKNRKENLEGVLPKGIWQRFHFGDDNPELPLLFLKGGAIVPTGPVIQHVGEAKLTDTITLLVALNTEGKAEGMLYEDDGDSFGFKHGKYLLTHYEAQQFKEDGDEVVVRVVHSEGQWTRPNRKLHVRLLLGSTTEVEGECKDGEELRIKLPSKVEINELVQSNRKINIAEREKSQNLLDVVFEEHDSIKGVGAVLLPIDLQAGNVTVKVVPWIGGRIISMIHKPSGYEWLEGRFESGCYEEYSGNEFRSAGCTEEYKVVKRDMQALDGQEFVSLEGDIGGGLILARDVLVAKNNPDIVSINSRIEARSVGAGSGGFSRLVRLRVHPLMKLVNPLDSVIKFTDINGDHHELRATMEFGEHTYEGTYRPNGEWRLDDTETGLAIINRFDLNQVALCLISWGPGSVTLELWSEERPVSKETPITITHEYEFIDTNV